jgi:IS30 family transposase
MARTYKQLSLEERSLLQTQLSMGWRPAAIAAGLQRARSSITREMLRNGWQAAPAVSPQSRRWGNGGYLARTAHRRAQRLRALPRVARKLIPGTPLWQLVIQHLRRGLSPAQIASTLARMPDPVRLSYETIYTAFYAMPRGQLRARVLALLRRRHPQRGARSPARHQRPFLDAMTLIDQRPAEVDERIVPGHWEGDLIKGAMNRSRVGTLVERTTLFVALVKLEDGRAQTTADGFARILQRFDSQLRLSLTYDQGREMAQHRSLAEQARLLRPPPQPVAAGHLRKHQRPAPPIPAQRPRPQPLLPGAARSDRHAAQRSPQKNPGLESPRRTLPPRRSLRLPKILVQYNRTRCTWLMNPRCLL